MSWIRVVAGNESELMSSEWVADGWENLFVRSAIMHRVVVR